VDEQHEGGEHELPHRGTVVVVHVVGVVVTVPKQRHSGGFALLAHVLPGGQSPLQLGKEGPHAIVVAQPVAVQASQQLANRPTQAEPPLDVAHLAGSLLMEHRVVPRLFVRQQVTKPTRPQIDRDAHLLTNRVQSLLTRATFACPSAQRT
jgi:hypothetical protein